jgi:hypothetical protein
MNPEVDELRGFRCLSVHHRRIDHICHVTAIHSAWWHFRARTGSSPALASVVNRKGQDLLASERQHEDANAGDKGHDGGESGYIPEELSHQQSPFPLCFYFVPFMFFCQQKNERRTKNLRACRMPHAAYTADGVSISFACRPGR